MRGARPVHQRPDAEAKRCGRHRALSVNPLSLKRCSRQCVVQDQADGHQKIFFVAHRALRRQQNTPERTTIEIPLYFCWPDFMGHFADGRFRCDRDAHARSRVLSNIELSDIGRTALPRTRNRRRKTRDNARALASTIHQAWQARPSAAVMARAGRAGHRLGMAGAGRMDVAPGASCAEQGAAHRDQAGDHRNSVERSRRQPAARRSGLRDRNERRCRTRHPRRLLADRGSCDRPQRADDPRRTVSGRPAARHRLARRRRDAEDLPGRARRDLSDLHQHRARHPAGRSQTDRARPHPGAEVHSS